VEDAGVVGEQASNRSQVDTRVNDLGSMAGLQRQPDAPVQVKVSPAP
jgi:hypothetical protein